eukprot:g1760.t1
MAGAKRRKYLLLKALLTATAVPESVVVAVRRRLKGDAPTLLHDATNPVKPKSGYFVDMRFSNRFEDRERFERIFFEMVEEAGAEREWGELLWPKTPTLPGGISDEIVPRCAEIPTLQELAHPPKGGKTFSICVVNGLPGNKSDTVLRCQLPVSTTFDGTSCFNFMKELVARYYGEPSTPVFEVARSLRLSDEAAAHFRRHAPGFPLRLLRLVRAVARNCDHWAWHAAQLPGFLEGLQTYGTPPEFWTDEAGTRRHEYRKLILNWDEEGTAALLARFKARGLKPFSGMAFAAVKAWEQTFGSLPAGVMQQASMQIRGYEPHYAERNLCGDWLIGPIHRIAPGTRSFEVADAVRMHKALHQDLQGHSGSVLEAFESRAFGKFRAGVQQYHFQTAQDTPVFDMMGAPFGMGFNTVNVNGRISLCVATSRFSMAELEAYRANVKKITDEL